MDTIAQEPLEPTFDPQFTDGQRADIERAHRWAYKAILQVLEGFKTALPTPSFWPPMHPRFWDSYTFAIDRTAIAKAGPDWWRRKAIVEATFHKMALLMSTKSMRYHKLSDCTGGLLGNTGQGQQGPINLCNDLFNDSWLRFIYFARADWVRALAVVHEMSHAVIGGTSDIKASYSVDQCYFLAKDEPDLAVQNAQNLAFLAMSRMDQAPDAEVIDTGIWTHQRVGGAGPVCGNGPAAAMIAEDILMLAYPEPEPPKPSPEARSVGGLMHYKVLDLHEGKNTWSEAWPMKANREIRSGTAPALAVVHHKVYCAYVDPHSSSLKFVSAGTSRTSSEGEGLSRYFATGWSELHWDDPIDIVCNVNAQFAPALAAFTGGQSSGLYAVYVDTTGQLKCVVLFWGEGFFPLNKLPSGFTQVEFDQPRESISAPALVLVNGQLKCLYRDKQLGWVTLAYQAAPAWGAIKDVQPGSWHLEPDTHLQLDTQAVALAPWDLPAGPTLVALGRGRGDDRTLHYACAPAPGGRWQAPVQTRACRTSFASALVSHGPVLHSFHQHDGGWIDWLTATAPKV